MDVDILATRMEIPAPTMVLWLGLAGMAAGFVVIAAVQLQSRREDVSHGVLYLFSCLIGVFAYVSFLVDRTAVHVGDRSFYVSHYLYWLLSEPLVVLAVALLALPPLDDVGEHRLRASLHGALVGTTIAWVAGGMLQAWARTSAERWAWFALAAVSALAMLWLLWRPVLHQGQIKGGEHLRDYRLMAALESGLVLAYLGVWFVGEPGLRVWSATVDIPIFAVLDVASSAGLGVVSVVLVERLSKHVSPRPGETSVAASARRSGNT